MISRAPTTSTPADRFDTWHDGWVNNTGSTVGYLTAPFAEQTIVLVGRQAMPLAYDNTSHANSEAMHAASRPRTDRLRRADPWSTSVARSQTPADSCI